MTREEVIEKGKFIVVPSLGNPDPQESTFDDLIKDKPCIRLTCTPYVDNCWRIPENEHHYLPQWSYAKLLPAAIALLKFPYDQADFYMMSNQTEYGNMPYLLNKNLQHYKVFAPIYNESDGVLHFDDYFLTSNEITSCNECIDPLMRKELNDPYHKLFKFAHLPIIVENQTLKDGKTLLLDCDSQAIPLIPILITYYKKVIILDNRFPNVSCWNIYKLANEQIDDVLIVVWDGQWDKDRYTDMNLK